MLRKICMAIWLCSLFALNSHADAQEDDLPDFPVTVEQVRMAFPGVISSGAFSEEVQSQRYLILADAGETLEVFMQRTSGVFEPSVRLLDTDENLLNEQRAADISGRQVRGTIEITERDWYILEVNAQPFSNQPLDGSYTLVLSGTTEDIYALLPAGHPPSTESLVIASAQFDSALSLSHIIPIAMQTGMELHVSVTHAEGIALTGTDGETTLADGEAAEVENRAGEMVSGVVLTYTATGDGWANAMITPAGDDAYEVSIRLVEGEVTQVDIVDSFITLTPTQTATSTNTPTDTPTFTATFTETHTPTATFTSTLTFTPTETFTPTATLTASATPRHSPTPTLTLTPTWTNTPVPTPTFTLTPRPTLTSTPEQVTCSGTLQSRLIIGDMARVIEGTANRIRSRPGLNGVRLGQIPGNGLFYVIDGPVCADGYAWWQVNYRGLIGWTAEADTTEYWLRPVDMRGQYPPLDRSRAPANASLLDNGRGMTDGRVVNEGHFQVEGYCSSKGMRTTRNDHTWYCQGGGQTVTLVTLDFDLICRFTYTARAFAIQDGNNNAPALQWRCYGYN